MGTSRRLWVLLLPALISALAAACAGSGLGAPQLAPVRAEPPCRGCTSLPMTPDVSVAITGRVSDLKARGGECQAYGEVLEQSLSSGRITIRPYMWREGSRLASAIGRPNGEMLLAREIDSLNVGVRTLDDVLWSVEHEAAHIAFQISSGDPAHEAAVDDHVRACRNPATQRSAR